MATVRELKDAFEQSGCAPDILQELMSMGEDVFLRTFQDYQQQQVQVRQLGDLQQELDTVTATIKTLGDNTSASEQELREKMASIQSAIVAKDEEILHLKEVNDASFADTRSLLATVLARVHETSGQVEDMKKQQNSDHDTLFDVISTVLSRIDKNVTQMTNESTQDPALQPADSAVVDVDMEIAEEPRGFPAENGTNAEAVKERDVQTENRSNITHIDRKHVRTPSMGSKTSMSNSSFIGSTWSQVQRWQPTVPKPKLQFQPLQAPQFGFLMKKRE